MPTIGAEPRPFRTAEEVIAWAEHRLGAVRAINDHSWPHGETRVLSLESGTGPVIVKAFRQPTHFARESEAYRHAAPALGDAAPRLILTDQDALILAVKKLPGTLAQYAHDHDPAIHARAGTLLRRLHDAAPPLVDTGLGGRLAASFERYAARSQGLVEPRDLARVRALLMRIMDVPIGTVGCHGDFSPRNWLVDGNGDVRLIDFARFQPDHWMMDTILLSQRYWRNRPVLRDAFFSGYGCLPDEKDQDYFRAATGRWAIGTIIWAHEHDDAPFAQLGRDALAALLPGD